MKSRLNSAHLTAWALGATAVAAHAQLDLDDPSFLKNRVSVSGQFLLNVSATIRGTTVPPQAGPQYDDGFVRPDVSGGAGGKTWYWGYQYANQVPVDANQTPVGTLNFHSLDGSPRDGRSIDKKDDYAPAFTVSYGRELKRWAMGPDKFIVAGLELGFGSTDANIATADTVSGMVSRTTYTYSLGGIVPPSAPYTGTYGGPGPLIGLTPTGTSADTVAATSALNARVRALMFGLRFGPFVEVPLVKRLSLQLSGGVNAMYANTELKFTETLTIDPTATGNIASTRDVSYHHGEWSIGYFGRAALAFEVSDNFRLFLGGEYQDLGDHTVAGPGLEATLKSKNTFGGVVGLQLLF